MRWAHSACWSSPRGRDTTFSARRFSSLSWRSCCCGSVPRGLRRSIADSDERDRANIGSGEPTPLWHVALIVVVLTGLAGLLGWDASLRVTAGCVLVGATQTLLLGDFVRREEHKTGRTFYRTAGSRILLGTQLAYIPVQQPSPPV